MTQAIANQLALLSTIKTETSVSAREGEDERGCKHCLQTEQTLLSSTVRISLLINGTHNLKNYT